MLKVLKYEGRTEMLLAAEKITKSYSEKKLLSDVSLFINEGEKIGVIGINGTGKTTLLKILSGTEATDSGSLTKAQGLRIGYLPQNPVFDTPRTILEQTMEGLGRRADPQKEYEAKSLLTRFGVTEFERDVTLLSGGQKKRVAIAAVLVNPCDVLIMDEPTNHLDQEMVTWLEAYLQKFTGALVMVTHDRYFLDRVVNRIVEIDHGALYSYEANFTRCMELKAQREEMARGTERKRQSLLKKELEWMMRGPRARGTKSKERIRRFEELSQEEGPNASEKLELGSVASRLGKKILEIENVTKAFGDKTVVNNFSLSILRDDRIGIVGKNGSGKTTLLKMIGDILPPDSGHIDKGVTVKIGYFSQEGAEMDTSLRVIDYIRQTAETIETENGPVTASQMLERFLFPPDLQWNTISRLSGGERRRLYLLNVIMTGPNLLLLDEPTNDLDIETLMVLEDYLEGFSGPVAVVSHDRYFLDKVVDRIFELREDGSLKQYLGGYTDYMDAKEEERSLNLAKAEEKKPEKTVQARESVNKKLKFTFKEQMEYDKIDDDLERLENDLKAVEEAMVKEASNYVTLQELIHKKAELEKALEEKTERWLYLNELAEKIALQGK